MDTPDLDNQLAVFAEADQGLAVSIHSRPSAENHYAELTSALPGTAR
jgi:hypothetical protein